MAAALKGYRCIFTMPDKMSQEKVRLLKAFGAEVIITPTAVPPDHPDSYVMMAARIAKETPNAILANQFYNPANPEAHYETTGPELWEQTEGKITHFVAAAGTGGTISGVGKYLKEKNPKVEDHRRRSGRIDSGRVLEEQGRAKARGSAVQDRGRWARTRFPARSTCRVIDDYRTVTDRESFAMARRLTREEGLFVGGSSGLIAHVAMQVAREVNDPERVRRHLPLRHRRALSLEALQRRMDAREPAARHRPHADRRSCCRENRTERHESSASRLPRAFARRSASCRCTMCHSCR